MSYRPPAGIVGHAVATLFGADPKHEMDEDLARMTLLIRRDAALASEAKAHEAATAPEGRPKGVWLPRT